MSKIILVSLVHNRKSLVGLALQSAANQTLDKSKFTHLLINNASTDGAEEVCKIFEKKYSNIKLVNMPSNNTQQKSFNHVLYDWLPKNAPEAEVMCNLDSDDELVPIALEEVGKMFDAHPEIGAAYSGFSLIDGKGNIMVRDHPKARFIPNQFTPEGQKILRRVFIAANPCGHIRCFRIKSLLDIGGFNTQYEFSTDYNAFGRMIMKYPVVKINKVLYKFRQHGNQVQGKQSPQQTLDWQNMQKEFKALFLSQGLI